MLRYSRSASRSPRKSWRMSNLPSITSSIPQDLRNFLSRVREYIESHQGAAAVVTNAVVTGAPVAASISPSNLAAVGGSAVVTLTWDMPAASTGYDYAQVWSAISDSIQAAEWVGTSRASSYIHQTAGTRFYWVRFVNTQGSLGSFAGSVNATAAPAYSATQLQSDLASGTATIIAGAVNGSAVVEVQPSYVLFKHRDANINGLGAGYSGSVRTALGITAGGMIAGFNKPADGAWQPSIVIDSATGNVTILGTLKAQSVIEAGAYIGSTGGGTIGDIQTDTDTALTNAQTALNSAAAAIAALGSKLNAQSVYILGSDFNLKTSSFDTGTGVGITNNGILGRKNGVTTFALDNLGNASFAGDISAASGTFAGNVSTAGYIKVAGFTSASYNVNGHAVNATVYGNFATVGAANTWNVGVFGNSSVGGLDAYGSIGTLGVANGGFAGSGYGVVGYCPGLGVGVWGVSASWSIHGGVRAENSAGGPALEVYGPMTINNSTQVANLNASLLGGYTAQQLLTGGSGLPAHTHPEYSLTSHTHAYAATSHGHSISDLLDSAVSAKFQYSSDGVTWTNLYLRRTNW